MLKNLSSFLNNLPSQSKEYISLYRVIVVLIALLILMLQPFEQNYTSSLKKGWYMQTGYVDKSNPNLLYDKIYKIPNITLPNSEHCKQTAGCSAKYMLKRIGALAGDTITITQSTSSRVDGTVWAIRKGIEPKKIGIRYKGVSDERFTGVVPTGKVYLYADSDLSVDSRYYGAISDDLVLAEYTYTASYLTGVIVLLVFLLVFVVLSLLPNILRRNK